MIILSGRPVTVARQLPFQIPAPAKKGASRLNPILLPVCGGMIELGQSKKPR